MLLRLVGISVVNVDVFLAPIDALPAVLFSPDLVEFLPIFVTYWIVVFKVTITARVVR